MQDKSHDELHRAQQDQAATIMSSHFRSMHARREVENMRRQHFHKQCALEEEHRRIEAEHAEQTQILHEKKRQVALARKTVAAEMSEIGRLQQRNEKREQEARRSAQLRHETALRELQRKKAELKNAQRREVQLRSEERNAIERE